MGYEFALIDVFELTSGDFATAVGGVGINVAVEGERGGDRFGTGGEGGVGKGEVGEDGYVFCSRVGDINSSGIGNRDALGGREVARAEGVKRFADREACNRRRSGR